jgi:hypothetical protein
MKHGDTAEKVIAILQRTEDGDKLSKAALKLTESAVNNHLNGYGLKLLDKLYEMVMDGSYSAAKFKRAIKDNLPTK